MVLRRVLTVEVRRLSDIIFRGLYRATKIVSRFVWLAERVGSMAVKMSPRAAQAICARYVCANCWEKLVWDYIDDNIAEVSCETEGCPCNGFVTKVHVEILETEAVSERMKVEFNLRKFVDWIPYEPMTSEQILKDLGF
jgi:hypothetical protein